MEKILLECLSQDGLDRLLRGEGAPAGGQKEGEGVPDMGGELQGDELQQPEGDTAQQDKTGLGDGMDSPRARPV